MSYGYGKPIKKKKRKKKNTGGMVKNYAYGGRVANYSI